MSTGRARGRARRADGAWRCFFSASAVLAVVVVGIPALLVACSRAGLGTTLPFPGIGSADEIRAFFERELTTTELVPIAVRALLIVGWLLWVALVSSVVASMFEARGRRAVGIPRLAMFAGIGRWIAAGLTALVTLAPSAAAGAPVARAPAVSLVSNPVPVARTGGEPAVARSVPAGFARVQAGESIETFAERTLGAPGRWVDVWELNQQRAVGAHGEVWTAPWRLSAGWDLRLPITRPAADATAATTRNASITGAHVVAAGDSYWEIAESLLAPGAAPGEVLDYTEALVAANAPRLGYADPNMLHPGDVLDIVAPPTTTTAPAGTTGPADPTPMATSHRVQPGDSYWAIADAALGDSAAPADVAELTRYLIDLNAPRLGYDDVRMIHPGDEVQLGNAALAPIEVSSEMPLPPPATATATAVFDSLWDETAPVPTATATAATSSTTATTTVSSSSTTTPAPVPAQPGDAGDGGGAARPSSPSPIGVGEAALLATGIVALIGARRRARLRAAEAPARLPMPRAESVALERGLRRIDSQERLLRVDVALRAAAPAIAERNERVLLVRAAADGTIEVVTSGPVVLSAPWVRSGTWWSLPRHVPVDELAGVARTVAAPCVALTTLGVDDSGCEILADIEAMGVLAIDAGPTAAIAVDGDRHDRREPADEIARAVLVGLASSEFAEVAQLISVGLDGGPDCLLGNRNGNAVATLDEAIELGAEMVGARDALRQNTFARRARRTGGEAWEPAVVIVASAHAGEVSEALLGHVRARPGLALVVAGPLPAAPWSLVATASGWTVQPLGLRLAPVGLTADDAAGLADLVEPDARPEPEPAPPDASLPLEDPGGLVRHDLFTSVEQFPVVVIQPDGEPGAHDAHRGHNGHKQVHRDIEAAACTVPEWDLMVTLVGAVGVVDRNGATASFERAKALELIAWMVTHRERSSRGAARAALWELDVRHATFANVVSEARRTMARLVEPPDGDEWLRRTLTDELSLHPNVVADVDVIRARLAAASTPGAEDAPTLLRPAVELVRELPFAGTSYLWPDPEGITSELVVLATTACRRYAELALERGDVEQVFWATSRGLAVLAGQEALIGLRMRAHALSGDLAGVRHEWDTYERVITADAWSDGEPAPHLVALRKQLLSP